MYPSFRRFVCTALIASLAGLGIPLPASAAMLPTQTALGGERAYLNSVLDRTEVRAQLQAQGVSPADVKARVAAMSDAEASELAQRIQSLPAGGDVLGVLVSIAVIAFIVLVITDLMGVTHVFPWTKK
jgi:hypothetical protein